MGRAHSLGRAHLVGGTHPLGRFTGQRRQPMRALPVPARVFVVAAIGAAAIVLVYQFPVHVPDGRVFALLALSCIVTSGLKLRLPLGHSSANLSVSYTVDFAA